MTLSVLSRVTHPGGGTGAIPPSPTASRATRAWWRDTRLITGVVLIVISMLVGARLLSGGDDTVPAWQATRDLAAGTVVGPDDVVLVSVPSAIAGAYAGGGAVPSVPLDRPVRAGEMLPAPVPAEAVDARWVTVPVEPLHAPVDLAPGERVDVWTTDGTDLGAVAAPELALEGVLVSQVQSDGVGLGGEYGVVLQIAPSDAAALIAAARGGGIDLVRVPVVTR